MENSSAGCAPTPMERALEMQCDTRTNEFDSLQGIRNRPTTLNGIQSPESSLHDSLLVPVNVAAFKKAAATTTAKEEDWFGWLQLTPEKNCSGRDS